MSGIVSDLAAIGAENCLHTTTLANSRDLAVHIIDLCVKWKEAVEHEVTISNLTFISIVVALLSEL